MMPGMVRNIAFATSIDGESAAVAYAKAAHAAQAIQLPQQGYGGLSCLSKRCFDVARCRALTQLAIPTCKSWPHTTAT